MAEIQIKLIKHNGFIVADNIRDAYYYLTEKKEEKPYNFTFLKETEGFKAWISGKGLKQELDDCYPLSQTYALHPAIAIAYIEWFGNDFFKFMMEHFKDYIQDGSQNEVKCIHVDIRDDKWEKLEK